MFDDIENTSNTIHEFIYNKILYNTMSIQNLDLH